MGSGFARLCGQSRSYLVRRTQNRVTPAMPGRAVIPEALVANAK